MDFGTLGARRHACETEIRVNRRFQSHDRPATQLYLWACCPSSGTPEDPRWGEDSADGAVQPAIEFAVQMQRFDEAARLDHLCVRGALTAEHIGGLARRMAAFQARAAVADKAQPWGHAAAAMRWPRDNFTSLRSLLKAPEDAALVRAQSDWDRTALHRDRTAALAAAPEGPRARRTRRPAPGQPRADRGRGVAVRRHRIQRRAALDRWGERHGVCMDGPARPRPAGAGERAAQRVAGRQRRRVGAQRLELLRQLPGRRAGEGGGDPRRAAGRQPGGGPKAWTKRGATSRWPTGSRTRRSRTLVITHGLSGSGKTWASGQWLQAETSGRAIRLRSDVERKRPAWRGARWRPAGQA